MPEGFDSIIADINRLIDAEKAVRVAAVTVHNVSKERIFASGKAADNSTIGKYSTKPTYVSLKQSPKATKPVGKTGKDTFASGKKHTSRYYPNGYKGFRSTMGRQTGKVDLRLTGQLQNDYIIEGRNGKMVSGFSNPTNSEKADGNESRYGKEIFALTTKEADLFAEILTDELFGI